MMIDESYARDVAYVIETKMTEAKYTQPALKLTDAKALVLAGKVTPGPDGTYLIQGSAPDPYCWEPGVGCSCPQSQQRKVFCKHSVAVELVRKVAQYRDLAQTPHPNQAALAFLGTHAIPRLSDEPFPGVEDVDLDTPRPEQDAPLPEPVCPPVPPALPWLASAYDGSTPHPSCGTLSMLRSLQVAHVIGALHHAQAQIRNPRFDAQNPHFKMRYASLAAVRDTLTPALTAAGLVVTQFLSTEEGSVCCETILWHISGEYLGATLRLPVGKADAQGYGAASTYARRYGLMALCNVVGDEDDDAESLRHDRGGLAGTPPAEAQRPGGWGRPPTPDVPPPSLPLDPAQAKRRIMKLLTQLGHRKEELTRQGVIDWVGTYTNLPLEERHYATIIQRLEETLPATRGA